MTDPDYNRKLDELDRLLNDPDSPMDPSKVWMLLAEVSRHDLGEAPRPPLTVTPGALRSETRGCLRAR
jgi:hypothetical protein